MDIMFKCILIVFVLLFPIMTYQFISHDDNYRVCNRLRSLYAPHSNYIIDDYEEGRVVCLFCEKFDRLVGYMNCTRFEFDKEM